MSRTTKKSAGLPPEQAKDKHQPKDDAKQEAEETRSDTDSAEYPPLKEKYRSEPAAKLLVLLTVDEFTHCVLCRNG